MFTLDPFYGNLEEALYPKGPSYCYAGYLPKSQ